MLGTSLVTIAYLSCTALGFFNSDDSVLNVAPDPSFVDTRTDYRSVVYYTG